MGSPPNWARLINWGLKLVFEFKKIVLVSMCVGLWLFAGSHARLIADDDMVEYVVKASEGAISGMSDSSSAHRLRFPPAGHSIQGTTPEYFVITIPKNTESSWVETMKAVPGVETVEPNYPVMISDSPASLNDPLIGSQAYLFQPTIVPALQILPKRSVKVAVVDTGVDRSHPDLEQQIAVNLNEVSDGTDNDRNGFIDDLYGYSFYGYSVGRGSKDTRDVHGHGTHIAGIIAAAANNGIFGAGINPSARIIPVPFMDSAGRGTQFDGAAAIKYAVDMGAEIINCSWGYYVYSGVLADAVEYARSRGVLVVAAAGNEGGTISQFPASFDSVISVGSCALSGQRSSFSNHNPAVDILAYGEGIVSTLPSGQYGRMSGTSQAAGVVSGVLSRLLAALPTKSITLDQIVHSVRVQSTDPGVIDAGSFITMMTISTADVVVAMAASVNGIQGGVHIMSDAPITVTNVLNFPNPIRSPSTQFGFAASIAGRAVIRIFDLGGRCLKTMESPVSQGQNAVSWDLVGDDGQIPPNGTYLYFVELKTDSGSARARGKLTVLR